MTQTHELIANPDYRSSSNMPGPTISEEGQPEEGFWTPDQYI